MNIEEYTARLGILFVMFAVISSGYVINAGISCQMQRFLQSQWGMHLVGYLMVFVFLIMEGGMSFDPSVDKKAPTDWTRANIVSTLAISFIVYSLFVLSSKMQFGPNILFYALIMTMYLLITHRRFLRDRNQISRSRDRFTQQVIRGLLIAALAVGAYGIADYSHHQHQDRGDDFSWWMFLVGNNCTGTGRR